MNEQHLEMDRIPSKSCYFGKHEGCGGSTNVYTKIGEHTSGKARYSTAMVKCLCTCHDVELYTTADGRTIHGPPSAMKGSR